MHLIYDEFNDYWVWVSNNDQDIQISPQFDTKEFAEEWYLYVKKLFKGK